MSRVSAAPKTRFPRLRPAGVLSRERSLFGVCPHETTKSTIERPWVLPTTVRASAGQRGRLRGDHLGPGDRFGHVPPLGTGVDQNAVGADDVSLEPEVVDIANDRRNW